ncbi:MAG: DUF4876 domain-containing protein [Bacteroidales bacterium]|nr:DUF4876 domain-containing protein [Bacteroidales bacterium]
MLFAFVAVSCEPKGPETQDVDVQLSFENSPIAEEGVTVTLSNGTASFEALTNADGVATFNVPVGVYTATISYKKSVDGSLFNYNGSANLVVEVGEKPTVSIILTESKASQLIIKELYNGGSTNDAGKTYQLDKYIIIYNNSDTEVDASRMGLAMAQITALPATNKYPITDGVISYDSEGWTPASYAIWWFQSGTEVKIAPYSQIAIAINGAIDHTQTYPQSVDLSNVDFCLYDIETSFNKADNYPAPSANIPESHHMKTYVFGTGTAWPFPIQSASPFILIPEAGVNLSDYVTKAENQDNTNPSSLASNYVKIPCGWVLDALELWPAADETKYFYRFPRVVNVGYQVYTNKLGYSTYRNVDKAATEAIAENQGKLVYDYAGAVSEEDSDPSGIDAEASIAAGAKIVFMDTNNSSTDFHLRKVATLKK